jgi:DNA-binding MarR family transcriptional regulator
MTRHSMSHPSKRSTQVTAAGHAGIPFLLFPQRPAYLARRFQQVCAGLINETLANRGLTQFQWGVLAGIHEVPGIDQRRLSDALSIVPENISQLMDELEAMGLVERRMNGTDRRTRQLFLTEKGIALRRRILPDTRAANERILEPLKLKERESFIKMLIRVIEGNKKYAKPGNGRRKRGSRLKSV